MKVLVTGAAGFIGNRLAHQLANEGFQVVALVRSQNNRQLLEHPNIAISIGDITQPETIATAINGCRQVYHVAGFARLWAKDPAVFYTVNVTGTSNILQAAKKEKIEKLVFASSAAVFGPSLREPITENDPRSTAFDNHYDLSKHLAEQEIYNYIEQGYNAVIVNPTRVYGPGLLTPANAIAGLIKMALMGKIIFLPGKATTIGNYAYVDDVVAGLIKAMAYGRNGERYILGGENKSGRELIAAVEQVIGPFPVMHVPLALAKFLLTGITTWKKITRQDIIYTASGISRYAKNASFDCTKACQELQYNITPMKAAIENTIQELLKEKQCHPQYSPS
jgi:nucleoside-diphosphate-sugar epimerase